MLPLTEGIPKSLLQVGDRLVLDWLLQAILVRTDSEIVVVTGYAAEKVEAHVKRHYEGRVRCARNKRYEKDTNILSVEVGVSTLEQPERGYLIIETDMLLEGQAWDRVFAQMAASSDSYWVCKGVYSAQLTGGIVHTDSGGHIDAIDYRPEYDPNFDGWLKMLGLLIVGPRQVKEDRRLRQAMIAKSISQYYLMPWLEGLENLPCKALCVDDCFAQSFNSADDYETTRDTFLAYHAQVLTGKSDEK